MKNWATFSLWSVIHIWFLALYKSCLYPRASVTSFLYLRATSKSGLTYIWATFKSRLYICEPLTRIVCICELYSHKCNVTSIGVSVIKVLQRLFYFPATPIGTVPPTLQNLGNQTVVEGENVSISCIFFSPSIVDVQWLKHFQVNGSWKDENDYYYIKRIHVSEKARNK